MNERRHCANLVWRSSWEISATIVVWLLRLTVSNLLICYPVADGVAEAAGFLAGAGREQGLQRIVDLSLATTRVDSPSPQGRAQWVAEQIFEWAGFAGVHLRIAAFFMENIIFMDGDSIRRNGRMANSFGDKPLSWISG